MIRKRINYYISEYLQSDASTTEWLKPAVRSHQFLPLVADWQGALGIRPDGSVVRWLQDEDRVHIVEGFPRRLALKQGSKEYIELEELVPERPTGAITCDVCAGTGVLPDPGLVCECGDLGWIMDEHESDGWTVL